MANPFVAEIRIFGFNFAPTGWAQCNGQILPISQNTALFSLLGTFYGGNGQSTFALPNLQGRVAIHQGQGPGLTDRVLGEQDGSESIQLVTNEMPSHTHAMTISLSGTPRCRNAAGNSTTPVGTVPAIEAAGVTAVYSDAPPDTTMRAESIPLGGNAVMGTNGSS